MATRKKTSRRTPSRPAATRSGARNKTPPKSTATRTGRPAPSLYQRIRYTATGPEIVDLGYKAAATIRTSGRPGAAGGSADYHLRHDLGTLRAESQAFDRDNGLFRGLVNRGLDNILSVGFLLQARTPNQKTNRDLELLWSEWGEDPEVRGLDDWASLERLALRHLWIDGDVGAIKIGDGKNAGGQLQMIEAERIGSRTAGGDAFQLGVELTDLGRPKVFHVAEYGQRGQVKSRTRPIQAADFVFIANRDRISQTRGCPVLVSNLPMLHRINDVCDSEAIAWQILSRLAIAIQGRDAESTGLATSLANPAAQEGDLAERYINVSSDAIMFRAGPGEEIKGIDRNIPGANFPQSITTFLRLLGLPLGMPLELVMLDWSKTNYSSARAALEQAYRMFKVWQRLLMRRWHGPIYRWKVSQWIEKNKIRDRPGVFKHEWFPPPFPWLDLLKEAQAKALSVDRGYATHGDVLKGENTDRGDFLERRSTEVDEAIVLANKLNEKHPRANVPWQMFAGISSPKQANVRPRETPKPAPAKPESDENKAGKEENDVSR